MPLELDQEIVRRNEADFKLLDDRNITGGLHTVDSTATRDAILPHLRKAGMLVCVQNLSNLMYQLNADLVTWSLFASGGGGGGPPLATTPPVDVDRTAAAVGTSTDAARADHKHDISVAAPVSVGTANAAGTSASLSKADHVHDHGAQSSGTLHAVAIAAGANGFLSGADKSKIDTIPALISVIGAVIVEDPAGTRVERRLTFDDVDPAFTILTFTGGPGNTEFGAQSVNPTFAATYNATLASGTVADGVSTPNIIGFGASSLSFTYNGGGSLSPGTTRTYQETATVNGSHSWVLTLTKAGVGAPTKSTGQSGQAASIARNLGLTRAYYGIKDITAGPTFNQTFIKSLPSNVLTASRSAQTYTTTSLVGSSNRIYLCWPTIFGNPVTIKDGGGFAFNMHKRGESPVAFTNTVGGGFVIPGGYDIWESDNFINSAFVLTVT